MLVQADDFRGWCIDLKTKNIVGGLDRESVGKSKS